MNNFGSGSMQTWSGGSKESGTNTGSGNNVINSKSYRARSIDLAKPVSPAKPPAGKVNKFASEVAGEARLIESV